MESLKSYTTHRPWTMPKHPWSYYQEWNEVVFLHYKVNEKLLRTFVPNQLELDQFNGECWVSIVAFNMEQINQDYCRLLILFLTFMNLTLEHM